MGSQNNNGLKAETIIQLCHGRALSLLKISSNQQANLLKQYIVCLALFFAGLSFLLGTTDYFAQANKDSTPLKLLKAEQSKKKEPSDNYNSLSRQLKAKMPFNVTEEKLASRKSQPKTLEQTEPKILGLMAKIIYLIVICSFIHFASYKFEKLNNNIFENMKEQFAVLKEIETEYLNEAIFHKNKYKEYSEHLSSTFSLGKYAWIIAIGLVFSLCCNY